MIFKATMELKWFESNDEGLKKSCASLGAFWPECGNTYYTLKQKWVAKNGEEEWREIPFDY